MFILYKLTNFTGKMTPLWSIHKVKMYRNYWTCHLTVKAFLCRRDNGWFKARVTEPARINDSLSVYIVFHSLSVNIAIFFLWKEDILMLFNTERWYKVTCKLGRVFLITFANLKNSLEWITIFLSVAIFFRYFRCKAHIRTGCWELTTGNSELLIGTN